MDMELDSEEDSDYSSLSALLRQVMSEMRDSSSGELSEITAPPPSNNQDSNDYSYGWEDDMFGPSDTSISERGDSHALGNGFLNESDDTGDSICNDYDNAQSGAAYLSVFDAQDVNNDGSLSSSSSAAITIQDDDVESVFSTFGVLRPTEIIQDITNLVAVGYDFDDDGYEDDTESSDDESTVSNAGFRRNVNKYFL